ncbi:hypothetical protein BT93_E1932 [Corymbia citriodora subsp. variegata]|nr:hypothetical protein BT93_E1932 [Corymbia citriodora subsp. variegata]
MASYSEPERKYDVFLSFRGTNLRNNFLGHLYKALDKNGIYAFIDSEELRKGDQISPTLMKAIEQSCIAIIIFSKYYASSQWCLEEATKIMECKEQMDLTVLPMFYKVHPREVREAREDYGRALAKHESMFRKDSEKVKRRKKALFDVGSLSGWHLIDGFQIEIYTTIQDESKLIQRIVKEISTHLDRTPLHVAKHLVGLARKKVLLILNDVDDLHQLNALAGEGNWLGDGSRIIITTRDKQLLMDDQDHVYEVEGLHDGQAHELFSKHAFQMHQIRRDLVDSALNYAKGLPLALEVLGSLLCNTTEDVWKSTLKKLSKNLDKTINSVLKVSFDGLDENEKEIFLHIACFFKGRAREYTRKVLDNCDLQTVVGFDILIKRSLISIEDEVLKVHDLIQAMGVDIVNQECRDDPGRRRLCYKSHSVSTT